MLMSTLHKLAKNGHSWQTVLSKAHCRALDIQPGDVLIHELIGKTIVISRAMSLRQATLLERERHDHPRK